MAMGQLQTIDRPTPPPPPPRPPPHTPSSPSALPAMHRMQPEETRNTHRIARIQPRFALRGIYSVPLLGALRNHIVQPDHQCTLFFGSRTRVQSAMCRVQEHSCKTSERGGICLPARTFDCNSQWSMLTLSALRETRSARTPIDINAKYTQYTATTLAKVCQQHHAVMEECGACGVQRMCVRAYLGGWRGGGGHRCRA